MPRYRKVSVQIWNDDRFHSASDQGKLAFLYILTHPQMTSLGCMRHTIAGLAAELGWDVYAFREAIAYTIQVGIPDDIPDGSRKPMLMVDEEYSLVVLPNFLKHNQPESINVVKSWEKLVELLPECPMLTLYFQEVKAYVDAMGLGFRDAIPLAIAKAYGIPKPKPKHITQYLDPPIVPRSRRTKPRSNGHTKLSETDIALFTRFWDRYPRGEKKQDAIKAWSKAGIDEVVSDAIHDALDWQIPKWAIDEYKFAPHPATYLNARRWEDTPPRSTPAKADGVYDDASTEIPF